MIRFLNVLLVFIILGCLFMGGSRGACILPGRKRSCFTTCSTGAEGLIPLVTLCIFIHSVEANAEDLYLASHGFYPLSYCYSIIYFIG